VVLTPVSRRHGLKEAVDGTVLHSPRRDTCWAHQNKQMARDADAAFSKGDADGAMRSINDSIE
jgi:hypothetical protein